MTEDMQVAATFLPSTKTGCSRVLMFARHFDSIPAGPGPKTSGITSFI